MPTGGEKNIRFEFEGAKYEVSQAAYNCNLIGLPDGRILEVHGWLELCPPKPAKLTVVMTDDKGESPFAEGNPDFPLAVKLPKLRATIHR